MAEPVILNIGDLVQDVSQQSRIAERPVMNVVFVDNENGVAECQYYDQYLQKHSHAICITRLEKLRFV